MRFLAAFFLCLIAFTSFSQVNVDTLLVELETDISEKRKAEIYLVLADYYKSADSITTAYYANKAMEICEKINFDEGELEALYTVAWATMQGGNLPGAQSLFKNIIENSKKIKYEKGEAKSLNGLGVLESKRGNYQKALQYYFQSVEINLRTDDKRGLGDNYNNIGIIFDYQGNSYEALQYYFKSLEERLAINHQKGIAVSYNNIGIIYESQGDFDQALDYYDNSLELYLETNDLGGQATIYNNKAFIYSALGLNEEALNFHNMALDIYRKQSDLKGIAQSFTNIGVIYLNDGEIDKSLDYYLKALGISINLSDPILRSSIYINIGEIYIQLRQFIKAKDFLNKGIEFAEEIGFLENIRSGFRLFSVVESELGNYQNAYEYLLLYKEIDDSLNSDQNTKNITRLEAEYEFEQVKDSIAFAQERQKMSYERKLENRNANIRMMFIVLAMVVVILIGFIFFNRKLSVLNREIVSQRDYLEQLNKTKTRFFSIISHDLRGPMSIMVGFNNLIKDHLEKEYNAKEDKRLEEITGYLRTSAGQVLSLLDSLLKWALKEEGVMPYNPALLAINDAVDETIKNMLPQATSKSISLDAKIEEDLKAYVDQNSFLTILRNLVNNSLKFTSEGGEIILNASKEAGRVKVQVQDNGVGIPEEKMKNLFEINEQKVSRGTKGEKGTGLGLNLVHDFVKMNKGEISVTSEVGKGTTFTMLFPSSDS